MRTAKLVLIECPTHGQMDAGRVDQLLPNGNVAACCPACFEKVAEELSNGTRSAVGGFIGDDGWRTTYIARLAPRYERSGPYHSEQEARTWAQRYNANNTDHPAQQAPQC